MKNKCIAIIQKQMEIKIENENYHLMMRVLQSFDANLKRFSWNDFDTF